MAEAGGAQPIIIKRIKKGAHGHHGGAWKVAYADFVTAMMAFFLLLWLLNAVTEEQLTGISNYFAPTTVSQSTSGAGGMLGGQTIGEGAQESDTSSPSLVSSLPPKSIGQGGEDMTDPKEGASEGEFLDQMGKREEEQFQKAKDALQEAVKAIPELKSLSNSLLIDDTPEGLRIQLVDSQGLPMFASGTSSMYGHTRALLELVARIVVQLPNKVAISGHTDNGVFNKNGYTNWELSADRALAARKVLENAGVSNDHFDQIIGRADREPLLKEDPSSPRNRRLSIVLLREQKAPPGPLPRP